MKYEQCSLWQSTGYISYMYIHSTIDRRNARLSAYMYTEIGVRRNLTPQRRITCYRLVSPLLITRLAKPMQD